MPRHHKVFNEFIDNNVSRRNIKRLFDIEDIKYTERGKWGCTACNREREATINSVYSLGTGCPYCIPRTGKKDNIWETEWNRGDANGM